LYVESDATLRDSLVRSLGQRGLGVDTASSRTEALRLLEHTAYPVIVADLLLPETDGVTLVHELRSLQPDASFIITTGFGVEYCAPGSLQDSIACYLSKPWTEGQLTNAVETARETYRVRRSAHAPHVSEAYAILLVEDDAADAEHLLDQLERGGVCSEIKHCQTIAHAASLLRSRQFDAVLVNLAMAGRDSRVAFEQLTAVAPDSALIVLSSHQHESENVLAVRRGAQDYLVKSHTDVELMRRALQHGIERKHQERKLAYLAHHDPLTQLVNRAAFSEKLEAAVTSSRRTNTRCAVMFLDLDGFKLVNDTYGHEAGDTVLCEVGRRIQASVREEDTVARLGGDEFGVLLAQVDDASVCTRVAQRILDITSMPVLLRDEVAVAVRASLGIAVCPESGQSGDALIRAADSTMYSAKAKGCGYLVHAAGTVHATEATEPFGPASPATPATPVSKRAG
jgi:diguanylate cyclase (GGDEF)-like protein